VTKTHTQARVTDSRRSTDARIQRLRDRCKAAQNADNREDLVLPILQGILDLLDDTLPEGDAFAGNDGTNTSEH